MGESLSGTAELVQTEAGLLRGRRQGTGSMAWLGVPYAAPPTGARRFRRPESPEPWTGERQATEFGNAAAQNAPGSSRRLGAALSEDCLYLNIYSPAADDAKRPVLVWIHGGAFLAGSGAAYDGTKLAESGDIVVVTINYRMGPFGFVNLASVVGECVQDNLGLYDQIQALRWVQENIASFGGDPARVTVAGESAGSVSVSLLMISPAATPYFSQAICQSGTLSLAHGPAVSVAVAKLYAAELGLRPGDADRLRAMPTEQLVKAQKAVGSKLKGAVSAAPWFDGELLPPSLSAALDTPTPRIPLLAGTNRDEVTLFAKLPGDQILPIKRPDLERVLRKQFSQERVEAVLAAYPKDKKGTSALGTDFSFGMPTMHLAERHSRHSPTFFYRFDFANLIFGATHALELTFLWDVGGLLSLLTRGPMNSAKRALGQRIQQAWISFVRDGNPGPDWPQFAAPRLDTRIFNLTDQTVSDPAGERRAVWAGRDPSPVPEPTAAVGRSVAG